MPIKSTVLLKEGIKMGFTERSPSPMPGASDPFINDVLLWLKGDDFTDSSSHSRSVSQGASASIETTIKKYGTGSFAFRVDNAEVLIPNVSGLTTLNDVTVEAWIYKFQEGSNHGLFQFNGKTTSSYQQNFVALVFSAEWLARVFSTVNGSLNNIIVNETWTHLAYVFNANGNCDIYVDGNKEVTLARTYPTLNTANDLMIGHYYTSGYFGGYMEGVRITNALRYTANFNPETDTYLAY